MRGEGENKNLPTLKGERFAVPPSFASAMALRLPLGLVNGSGPVALIAHALESTPAEWISTSVAAAIPPAICSVDRLRLSISTSDVLGSAAPLFNWREY